MPLNPAKRVRSPRTLDQTIRSTFEQITCDTHFYCKPGLHLPFNRVLTILSSHFDLALVLVRSGIESSSTSRQLYKLQIEGVRKIVFCPSLQLFRELKFEYLSS